MRTEHQNKILLEYIYRIVVEHSIKNDDLINIESLPYYKELIKGGFDANIYFKYESSFSNGGASETRSCYCKRLWMDSVRDNLQQFYLYTFCLELMKRYPDGRPKITQFITNIKNDKERLSVSAYKRACSLWQVWYEQIHIDELINEPSIFTYSIDQNVSYSSLEKNNIFVISRMDEDIPVRDDNYTLIETFLGMPIYNIK